MVKRSPSDPPGKPALDPAWSFGRMLRWHLEEWGTRSGGSPSQPGDRWRIKDFCYDVKVTRKTLENWRNDLHLPADPQFEAICTRLFGENPEFAVWKEWLAASLLRTRAAKTPVPLARTEIVALAFAYLCGFIPLLAAKAFEGMGWLLESRNFGAAAGLLGVLVVLMVWYLLRRHAFSQIENSAYSVSFASFLTFLAIVIGFLLELHAPLPLFPLCGILGIILLAFRSKRSLTRAEIILFWFHVVFQSAIAAAALVDALKWYECCTDYFKKVYGPWAATALFATSSLATFRWRNMSTLEAGAYLVGMVVFLAILSGFYEWLAPFVAVIAVFAPIGLALFIRLSPKAK